MSPPPYMTIELLPMRDEDLDDVVGIQGAAYPPLLREAREVFASKLEFFAPGCWLARVDGGPAGYLFSHPWFKDAPPAINAPLVRSLDRPDCYFIHDLAVAPASRGLGIAARLWGKARQAAQREGYDTFSLVSVQSSDRFWVRFGFETVAQPPASVMKTLRGYGAQALYMTQRS